MKGSLIYKGGVNIKKFINLFIILFASFILTSCGIILPKLGTPNPSKDTILTPTTTNIKSVNDSILITTATPSPNPKPRTYDKKQIQEVAEKIINDQMWWRGDTSLFHDFYNKHINYKLFVDEGYINEGKLEFYFLLKDEHNYNAYITYGIKETNNKFNLDGFDSQYSFKENEDLNYATNYLLNLGYKEIGESEFYITKIEKPIYTPMNEDKQKILQKIKDGINELSEDFKESTKIYIRDFYIKEDKEGSAYADYIQLLVTYDNICVSYTIQAYLSQDKIIRSKPDYLISNDNDDFWRNYVEKVKDNAVLIFEIN